VTLADRVFVRMQKSLQATLVGPMAIPCSIQLTIYESSGQRSFCRQSSWMRSYLLRKGHRRPFTRPGNISRTSCAVKIGAYWW